MNEERKRSNNLVATKIRCKLCLDIRLTVNNVWWHFKVEEVLNGSKELPESFEGRSRDNESLRVCIVKLL